MPKKINRIWSMAAGCMLSVGAFWTAAALGQQDVADVPSRHLRAGADARKRYFLIGPAKAAKAPAGGFRLLIVMPGGDGGAAYLPFVKRIYKHALPKQYLVAQLVAVKWTSGQEIVWPTGKAGVTKQKFTTEQFAAAVIEDVKSRHKIDDRYVFSLSWSSGGPAAYALSLQDTPCVTGSFIAMSVFKPRFLPPLSAAKQHAYFLYHSPQDKVCPFRMARAAVGRLKANGAKVNLVTYQGGHGWRGGVYPAIRKGVGWLEANCAPPARSASATQPSTKPSSADLAIRPGVGIGQVEFGMSAAEVTQLLGPPARQSERGSRLELRYDKLGMKLIFSDDRLVRLTLEPLKTDK